MPLGHNRGDVDVDIEIFTGPKCSYCADARELLRERGLTYRERDISEPSVMAEFRERLPRHKSIPQVFVDGEHIGGFEDLQLRLS